MSVGLGEMGGKQNRCQYDIETSVWKVRQQVTHVLPPLLVVLVVVVVGLQRQRQNR